MEAKPEATMDTAPELVDDAPEPDAVELPLEDPLWLPLAPVWIATAMASIEPVDVEVKVSVANESFSAKTSVQTAVPLLKPQTI